MRRHVVGAASLVVALVLWGHVPRAQDKVRAVDALLASYHDAGLFNGAALVSDHGKVMLKKGYGFADFEWKIPNTPDTKFRIGSITKQFTAAVVMQLVEEGTLSLDATLSSVLPYYRADTGAKITVHHLLSHTSGIPSYTGLPNFFRDVSRNPYGVREFVEKYCSGNLEFEPGSRFAYNNSGYFLLGAIIESVTKKPYAQVVRERVFEPLGMNGSGYDLSGPILEKRARGYESGPAGVRNTDYLDMGLPYAAGSLYSTVEDLYIWDQALYGEKLLPSKAKDRMFTPGLGNYAYGWVVQKRPIGVDKAERLIIGHDGGINGFNTIIRRVPEDRHLVVLFNNTGWDESRGDDGRHSGCPVWTNTAESKTSRRHAALRHDSQVGCEGGDCSVPRDQERKRFRVRPGPRPAHPPRPRAARSEAAGRCGRDPQAERRSRPEECQRAHRARPCLPRRRRDGSRNTNLRERAATRPEESERH
jgi:CubicO group peptidase (beta-lactamase class C family)